MNVTRENIDALNASITVKIEKSDYEQRVDNILKDYKKKARIDGFRPGKVPMGMIKKFYYKPTLAEEVNKILSESLSKYLVDEKLNILGEPLPSENEQTNIDWDSDSEFSFKFDIGMSPEIDFSVSPKDKFPFYKIKIDDEMRSKFIENHARRFGSFEERDAVNDKAFIKVSAQEVDDTGQAVENGITAEESSIALEYFKDDYSKKLLLEKKTGDKIVLDIQKAFPNEADLAGFLNVKKEELPAIKNKFELTIKTISEFVPAEVNQELYDKIYGEGEIKSEEEFHTKIDEEASAELINQSLWKFNTDVKEAYLKKIKADFPEAFLKRWLMAVDKEKNTPEVVDKDFPNFIEDLKWQLIKDKIAKDADLKVSEEEAKETAKQFARYQYMQYGMAQIPEEYLDNYANELMKRDDERRRFYERKMEEKVFAYVKETAKIDEKEISSEKFNKMVEK